MFPISGGLFRPIWYDRWIDRKDGPHGIGSMDNGKWKMENGKWRKSYPKQETLLEAQDLIKNSLKGESSAEQASVEELENRTGEYRTDLLCMLGLETMDLNRRLRSHRTSLSCCFSSVGFFGFHSRGRHPGSGRERWLDKTRLFFCLSPLSEIVQSLWKFKNLHPHQTWSLLWFVNIFFYFSGIT